MSVFLEFSSYKIGESEQVQKPIRLKGLEVLTIGRSQDCSKNSPTRQHVFVASPKYRVSRMHLLFKQDAEGPGWTVQDGDGRQGSVNGSTLNRSPLREARLRDGDVIEFPVRPRGDLDVLRYKLIFRDTPDEQTTQSKNLLPWWRQLARPAILELALLAIALILLVDAIPHYVNPTLGIELKEWFEAIGGAIASLASLLLAVNRLRGQG